MQLKLISEKSGIAFVLLAVSLWGTVGISVKLVPSSPVLTPEFLAFARTIIGGAAMLLVALVFVGPHSLRINRFDICHLAKFAMANAVFQIGLFQCFEQLGVTVTAFLTGCLPPAIAATWALFRRPGSVAAGTLASLGLSVLGLAFIASGGDLTPAEAVLQSGMMFAVATSIAFIVMSDAAQSLGRTLQPMAATGIGLTFSGALLLIVALATSSLQMPTIMAELSKPHLLHLSLYLGLVPTALAFLLFCKGIALCSSALVGLTASMFRPAVAMGLSVWILSDTPSAVEAMGCALLMLAMVILWQSERSLARKRIGTTPSGSTPP